MPLRRAPRAEPLFDAVAELNTELVIQSPHDLAASARIAGTFEDEDELVRDAHLRDEACSAVGNIGDQAIADGASRRGKDARAFTGDVTFRLAPLEHACRPSGLKQCP